MAPNKWWACFLMLAGFWSISDACSCMVEHPQASYCRADFVIVATVRRLIWDPMASENVYKVKIRREFKMSEKAKVALKSGRIMTAFSESMCGKELNLNQTYLITGSILSLQARINLCNYIQPWKQVTPRQRKGFRMLYKQGCPCRILPCTKDCNKPSKTKHVCRWTNPFDRENCHSNFGICLINPQGTCHWARAPKLNACLAKKEEVNPFPKKLIY